MMSQVKPKSCGPLPKVACEEIARELNLTEAAVMTQVFRARQKLKSMLEGGREAELHGLP